ncbi:MAG: sensor histidine kinase [Burkholderiaceae bacterium]|nr:sensor histidine kinase [Burkholderiaceae bacterium]
MNTLFQRRSLAEQFLMLSFPILLTGTLVIGWWVGRQVEDSVVHRIGSVTALYVDSFAAPHVQTLLNAPVLSAADIAALRSDLSNTPLGQRIVSLRIWRPDGHVLFSNDATMGRSFPIDEGLADALAGHIYAEISERSDAEQSQHGQPLPRLIETYTPIHADRSGEVIAAAEFYERPDEVDRDAGQAQRRSWLLVAAAMTAMYLLLFLLVRRGSQLIDRQRRALGTQVQQLTALNEQNGQLQQRVIRAAERATTLNEHLLQRISADIHDGPGQDLGFALMQLKNMDDASAAGNPALRPPWANHLEPARLAVQAALADLRAISADMELPDIEHLSLVELAARVLRDFQAKTSTEVVLDARLPELDASFRVKVTLYRLLQESLANAFRHAQGRGCRVLLRSDDGQLRVEVSDQGPGFDPRTIAAKGRLGLHGMRQRVEVLGGTFALHSVEGTGTTIRVTLPLRAEGPDHE